MLAYGVFIHQKLGRAPRDQMYTGDRGVVDRESSLHHHAPHDRGSSKHSGDTTSCTREYCRPGSNKVQEASWSSGLVV
jgi:hypothetical protein